MLEGRAVQDVWIAPARKDRDVPGRDSDKDIYGTTVRVCDPGRDVAGRERVLPETAK